MTSRFQEPSLAQTKVGLNARLRYDILWSSLNLEADLSELDLG